MVAKKLVLLVLLLVCVALPLRLDAGSRAARRLWLAALVATVVAAGVTGLALISAAGTTGYLLWFAVLPSSVLLALSSLRRVQAGHGRRYWFPAIFALLVPAAAIAALAAMAAQGR